MKRVTAAPLWRQPCLCAARPSPSTHTTQHISTIQFQRHLSFLRSRHDFRRPTQARLTQPHQRIRRQSSAASMVVDDSEHHPEEVPEINSKTEATLRPPAELFSSPDPAYATSSAKLHALHARLCLPENLPIQTLARTLVDETADPDPNFNNTSLALLGADILAYHTSEHLICNHPRLPMETIFAATSAYIGADALSQLRHEWGVEFVAEPGGEVDPGLLQLRFKDMNTAMEESLDARRRDLEHGGYDYNRGWLDPSRPGEPAGPSYRRRIRPYSNGSVVSPGRPKEERHFRRGISSRVVNDDEFGIPRTSRLQPSEDLEPTHSDANANKSSTKPRTTTLQLASATFVRALIGALTLHSGRRAAALFHARHILSRSISLPSLITFALPTFDLSRLCAREGFEPPLARLLSETGRQSRHPVYVVGVFSGAEMLGEGVGSSLDEAKRRASAAAMRAWYLYRPVEVTVPSVTEGAVSSRSGASEGEGNEAKPPRWVPNMVDCGEIITS